MHRLFYTAGYHDLIKVAYNFSTSLTYGDFFNVRNNDKKGGFDCFDWREEKREGERKGGTGNASETKRTEI